MFLAFLEGWGARGEAGYVSKSQLISALSPHLAWIPAGALNFFFPLEHFLCILPGFHLVEAWRFFSHPHPRVVTAALAFYFSITILPTTCITILTLLP